MEADQHSVVKEVNGINLDNYFPQQSSFNNNTVIYVHKRFLKKPPKEETVKIKREKSKKKLVKEDKATNCDIKDTKSKKEGRNDTVLQQTIRFAKNLVPLVIPPSEDNEAPVFYTIKTCTKCKKKDHQEKECDKCDDATFEKKKSKKLIETFRKENKNYKDSHSGRYSVTHSSQSTLDDINNMNQSLCGTLSDLSEKRGKLHKNLANNKKKRRGSEKLGISESFEALATELNDTGETKIKVHLMSEKEKHFLSESIRIPVLEAVKECIRGLNNTEVEQEVKSVKKYVNYNSHKLDCILDKLTSIEKHLANLAVRTSPKNKKLKASKLEQLGEDLTENKEYSSEEDVIHLDSNRERTDVTALRPADVSEDFGGGELPGTKPSTSVGVKTDKNRLPARFCWTDAARNNY